MELLREFPPRTLPVLLAQRDALLAYAVAAPSATLAAFSLLYILMQTLAIPGTLALSVLAGALYGHWIGWALVSGERVRLWVGGLAGAGFAAAGTGTGVQAGPAGVPAPGWGVWAGGGSQHPCHRRPFPSHSLTAAVSTVGAWTCYQLSYLIGRPLAAWAWPQRLRAFAGEVAARRGQLTLYVILLRVTPVLPNIFINIASPVVGVPALPFVAGGCAGRDRAGGSLASPVGSAGCLASIHPPLRLAALCLAALCLAGPPPRRPPPRSPPRTPPPHPSSPETLAPTP